MRPRPVNVLTALSLLLCLGVAALWVRSSRADPLVFSAGPGSTWSMRNGRLTMYVPPAPAESAGAIRNDQVQWYIHRQARGFWRRGDTGRTVVVVSGTVGAAGSIGSYSRNGTPAFSPADVSALLRGLESADSFAAAHIRLAQLHRTDGSVTMQDRPDGACVATVDGLCVVLRPGERYLNNRRHDTVMYFASAEIDPQQLSKIQDLWNRRLSTPVWSASLGWAVAAMAVAPALSVSAKLRSLRRRRKGNCPVCGYDLRATPGRCPECGSEV